MAGLEGSSRQDAEALVLVGSFQGFHGLYPIRNANSSASFLLLAGCFFWLEPRTRFELVTLASLKSLPRQCFGLL